MGAWIKALFSSDDSQASVLHVVLIWCAFLTTFPMLVMCILAFKATEPFSATTQSMGTFIKDFGIGMAAIYSGAGGMWFLKGQTKT